MTNSRARLAAAPAEILGWRLESLARIGLSLSAEIAFSNVLWQSGDCLVAIESGETAVCFYYQNELIARIDHQGNLELGGQLIEPTIGTTKPKTSMFECASGILKLNVARSLVGGGSDWYGCAEFQSDGDLTFDATGID